MLARSVLLNILGSAASLSVGFVSSLLLARLLGPSDRGLLGIMFSVSQVGVAVAGLGLPVAIMYYASLRNAKSGALLGNSIAFTALLTAIFVPLAWIFHEQIADLFSRGRGGEVWILAAVLVPLTFIDWTTHNQLLGKLRFGLYNVLVVLSKIATLIAVLVLLVGFDLGVAGVLIATGAASVVMIVGSLPPILREGRPSLNWSLFRETVHYGLRVQVGTIIQFLNYRFDVIVLQFFKPLKDVGYYVVASILAELVVTLALAFQSSLLPLTAHYEGDEAAETTTRSALRHHGILAVVATLANVVFAPLVLLVGYGPSFRPALGPMFILLPGMWFLGTGTVVAGNLRGRGRPGMASVLAGGTLIVTVALDLALIPPLGVPGAAVASVVSYVVFGISSIIVLSRISGIPARELVVPTREDFAVYPAALRRVWSSIRPGRRPPAEKTA